MLKQKKVYICIHNPLHHKIMLRHIGIQISDIIEIENFYIDILGFREFDRFNLRDTVAKEVFGTEKPIIVSRLKQFNLILEILVHPSQAAPSLNHVALEFWKAADVIHLAQSAGYKVIEFKKENGSMARFVRDKSGNLFEIKEINLL